MARWFIWALLRSKGIAMIEKAVRILNELQEADPAATIELFQHEVRVNQQVCEHPTIQVRGSAGGTEGRLTVLGLLNGVLQEGNKVVIAEIGECGVISRFLIGILKDGKAVPMSASSE